YSPLCETCLICEIHRASRRIGSRILLCLDEGTFSPSLLSQACVRAPISPLRVQVSTSVLPRPTGIVHGSARPWHSFCSLLLCTPIDDASSEASVSGLHQLRHTDYGERERMVRRRTEPRETPGVSGACPVPPAPPPPPLQATLYEVIAA